MPRAALSLPRARTSACCARPAMLEETTEVPILIGRPEVIAKRLERAGLSIKPGTDFELVNPQDDPRYRDYWQSYHQIMQRRGVTPDLARAILRTNTTAIGAIMVHRGDADSLICGTFGQYLWHLNYITQILGGPRTAPVGALSLLIQQEGNLFVADTQVHPNPTPEQIVETAIGAARHVRRFGLDPKVALCSHSQFGNLDTPSGRNMRAALDILDAWASISITRARCMSMPRSTPSCARGFCPMRGSAARRMC